MLVWSDIVAVDWEAFGKGLIKLVQDEGATGIDAVKEAVVAVKALTGRDFPTLWEALSKEVVDVKELVAAVKADLGSN